MKTEHVLSIRFSNLRIRVSEGHFQCVHTVRFSEPTKIGSLITDRVNGPLDYQQKRMTKFTLNICLESGSHRVIKRSDGRARIPA